MDISKETLINHFGHQIIIARYGSKKNPHDMTIECEDCNEVLYSIESKEEEEEEDKEA